MSIRRIYVEKRSEHAIEAKSLKEDIKRFLNIKGIEDFIILHRYDIEGLTDDEFNSTVKIVFAEPMVDLLYIEEYPFLSTDRYFAVEYLPGQFDMRSDSAIQSVKVIVGVEDISIRTAKIYLIRGDISSADINKIKAYLINKVDQRESVLTKPLTLKPTIKEIEDVKVIDGFIDYSDAELSNTISEFSLSMNLEDIKSAHNYFSNIEKRNPTETEIKLLDTYWSDHCRHTTFNTVIDEITINDGTYSDLFKSELKAYITMRETLYTDRLDKKPITLMDLATISTKARVADGTLTNLEDSEENNAASIEIDIKYSDGDTDKVLLMFKNETHNHPTEIEPFGGAATCLGGAIRDPLSGRAYVYQAMRITGSADPRERVADTLEGKLPQIKITREAARGYSSYGNQIGIATGFVKELYHPLFKAKRMEVGAVIGAVRKADILRGTPINGDLIIMLGGRTGRDGVGGATGSSKEQDLKSIDISSAEVQKGNAPEEHKLLRLFRKPIVIKMIKKANDFGAGGVSVAVGELATGVDINLNLMPKKYEGLSATELALSESQERMAVIIDPKDLEQFMSECDIENIEATLLAEVTDSNRLIMRHNNKIIVDISRDFLDSAGATRVQNIEIDSNVSYNYFDEDRYNKTDNFYRAVTSNITDINIAIQQGLVESFDFSIGARTVLSPYGGKYQLTESESMISMIPTPILTRDTDTVSVVSYGYNPYLSESSPFHGAYFAVIESVTKLVAAGVALDQIRLSFQEYFERLGENPTRWGKPFLSLLGALKALNSLSLASIGGKDSMSGTYRDENNNIEITVPPTLISFAFSTTDINRVVSGELKKSGERLFLIKTNFTEDNLLDIENYKNNIELVDEIILDNEISSIYTIKHGGLIEAVVKMGIGNMLGVDLNNNLSLSQMQFPYYGSFIVSTDSDSFEFERDVIEIGKVIDEPVLRYNDSELFLSDLADSSIDSLASIFSSKVDFIEQYDPKVGEYNNRLTIARSEKIKPSVAILALPGSNCEYDTKRAFELAGSRDVEPFIFRNRSASQIKESIEYFANLINTSQILAIPGGFSAGDEPDGSGKFFVSVFMNPLIRDAIDNLINKRDGLVIGICNGFQALIKSGLITKGYISELTEDDATLSFNTIGRHVSRFVHTRVSSVKSPWLALREVGEIDITPVSHGEGRFTAPKEAIDKLFKSGQVAFQYVDMDGKVTMQYPYNPNGSAHAIEGITSLDGRVLGKMSHSERYGNNLYINSRYGNMDQQIFTAGVKYFL